MDALPGLKVKRDGGVMAAPEPCVSMCMSAVAGKGLRERERENERENKRERESEREREWLSADVELINHLPVRDGGEM